MNPFKMLASLSVLLLMLAVITPDAQAQRGQPQSVQPCQELMQAVRGSRSPDELSRRLRDHGATADTMRRCSPQLEREASIMQILRARERDMETLATRQQQRSTSRRSAEQLPINRRVIEARNQGSARAAFLRRQAAQGGDQARRDGEARSREAPPASATPLVLSNVVPTPMVPHTVVAIDGEGFGNSPVVELVVAGTVLPITVTESADTWIIGELGGGTGLPESTTARIQVRNTQSNQSAQRFVHFIPPLELDVVTDVHMASSSIVGEMLALMFIPGAVVTETFFRNKVLSNHWVVSEVLPFDDDISCGFDGAKPQPGEQRLESRVRMASHLPGLPPMCLLKIEVIGPVGSDHGL